MSKCFILMYKIIRIHRLIFSAIVRHQCASIDNTRLISMNNTEEELNNHSLSSDWSSTTNRVSGTNIFNYRIKIILILVFVVIVDEQSNNKLLFYIVIPMSLIVFILSILIIILLTKSNRKRRRFHHQHYHKTKKLLSMPIHHSHTYTNNVLYRTNNNEFISEKKNLQRLFPIKSEFSVRPISYPIYSSPSSHSLPPLVLPSPSPPLPTIPPIISQPLSVRRLYRSYV